MEELQVAFEPYADQTQKDIVVNGVDYHNIAATGHAAYYPVGFICGMDARRCCGLSARSGRLMYVTTCGGPARGAGNATRLVRRPSALCDRTRLPWSVPRQLQLPGTAALREARL